MSVSTLRESRGRAASVFLQFTRLYKQRPSALYCFFEGEDSKYYGVRIDTIARPEESSYLICNGKEAVIAIHRLLASRKYYAKANVAYFVDRDFDGLVHKENIAGIYETPCYSIENFYTSINCLSKILKSEFKLIESDEDFEKCVSLYSNLQREFHDATELLNIWIACQKDKSVELKISDLSISKFVRISLSGVQTTYTINDLYVRFPNSQSLTQEELDQKRMNFLSGNRQKVFRGKFEIEFLIAFLEKLSSVANRGSYPYFSRKVKTVLNVSRKTAISSLSQYADTPDCLYKYLIQLREISS